MDSDPVVSVEPVVSIELSVPPQAFLDAPDVASYLAVLCRGEFAAQWAQLRDQTNATLTEAGIERGRFEPWSQVIEALEGALVAALEGQESQLSTEDLRLLGQQLSDADVAIKEMLGAAPAHASDVALPQLIGALHAFRTTWLQPASGEATRRARAQDETLSSLVQLVLQILQMLEIVRDEYHAATGAPVERTELSTAHALAFPHLLDGGVSTHEARAALERALDRTAGSGQLEDALDHVVDIVFRPAGNLLAALAECQAVPPELLGSLQRISTSIRWILDAVAGASFRGSTRTLAAGCAETLQRRMSLIPGVPGATPGSRHDQEGEAAEIEHAADLARALGRLEQEHLVGHRDLESRSDNCAAGLRPYYDAILGAHKDASELLRQTIGLDSSSQDYIDALRHFSVNLAVPVGQLNDAILNKEVGATGSDIASALRVTAAAIDLVERADQLQRRVTAVRKGTSLTDILGWLRSKCEQLQDLHADSHRIETWMENERILAATLAAGVTAIIPFWVNERKRLLVLGTLAEDEPGDWKREEVGITVTPPTVPSTHRVWRAVRARAGGQHRRPTHQRPRIWVPDVGSATTIVATELKNLLDYADRDLVHIGQSPPKV